jgi:hypothetical protein
MISALPGSPIFSAANCMRLDNWNTGGRLELLQTTARMVASSINHLRVAGPAAKLYNTTDGQLT